MIACVLRDQVQQLIADAIATTSDKPIPEPLYTVAEAELVRLLQLARGPEASAALAKVYRRLRALPSRSQAAAPWSTAQLLRRDFDTLYRDVGALCRTLGSPLREAEPEA